MQMLLVGDTRADPRARQAVDANATEIARFQSAARENAMRNGLPQSGLRRTTSTGIQLRYTFNNGMEVLQIYVPLTTLPPVTPPTPEGSAIGVLAIDVLFAATPYVYTVTLDPLWGTEQAGPTASAQVNHTACWAVGATITSSNGLTYDMVSCAAWGASGTGSKRLSVPNQAAFGVTKSVTAAARTLAHPADPIYYEDATNGGDPNLPYYIYPLTADNIYPDMIGCTFLVHALAKSEQISIDLYIANLNSAQQSGLEARIGIGWGSIYNIQCREFDSEAILTNVTVPIEDTIHTLNLTTAIISGSGPSAVYNFERTSESGGSGPSTSWSFVALDGWQDSGSGPPADRNAKNMGDLLYASQDDTDLSAPNFPGPNPGALTLMPRAAAEYMPPVPAVKGVAVPLPPFAAWDSSALRTAPTWPGSAASMEPFATINYTSRGQPGGKGSVSIEYIADPSVWPGPDSTPAPIFIPNEIGI